VFIAQTEPPRLSPALRIEKGMTTMPPAVKPRIAVFSGPTATIQNSEPLVTSNKARHKYGLPLRTNPDGSPLRFDALRPQRLAAPVTVYIAQFSAHPLERDAAELYAPPDGYLDPSGGYTKGLPASKRTDVGEGDLAPETLGQDFFPYRPAYLRSEPPMASLARLTNVVQQALASGPYAGAIWLEGSPFVEETSYWLNLLIDTSVPLVGNASQRAHGAVSNDGDRNIIDAVDYILSRIWADNDGRDSVGVVVIQDEQVFTAREVQKADARPGGYVATGGHGGIVGTIGQPGPPALTFRTVKRHTHTSSVNLSRLPEAVEGTQRVNGRITRVAV